MLVLKHLRGSTTHLRFYQATDHLGIFSGNCFSDGQNDDDVFAKGVPNRDEELFF